MAYLLRDQAFPVSRTFIDTARLQPPVGFVNETGRPPAPTGIGFDTLVTAPSTAEEVADVSADPGQEENAEAQDDKSVPGGALPVSQTSRHQFIQEHDSQHERGEKPDERREDREH
jgi:hypothetical protein